ncbi:MAG: LysR family transcriptional regulator [Parvularcula sp.]|nr:LysR family transcriptional regulator [Parvularcula sp.]
MATFQILARTGTISAAAHELGVAPSAVSRRLKALEERLGTELVRRSTRAMVLTPAGEAYLAKATALLTSIEALEDEIRDEALGHAGHIRLAAPLSFGIARLPAVLSRFLADNPNITVELNLRDDQVDLLREGYDLALRIGELAPSTLIAKKIGDLPTVVAASPGFVQAHGPFQSPHDLEGVVGLIYANKLRSDVLHWQEEGAEQRVQLNRGIVANNGDILAEFAAAGHGVYAAPRFIMQKQIDEGRLVEICAEAEWPKVALHVIWPPTKHLPVRVRALIDTLAAAFTGSPQA